MHFIRIRLIHRLGGVLLISGLVVTSARAAQPGHPPLTHVRAPVHVEAEHAHPTVVPVPQRIAASPALVARLRPLLPSGMSLQTAATGFHNEGQFIAALHVAHNLNIPFAQLKAEMTGSDHDSLGQAIHDLRPNANAKAAVKTATQEARADLRATRPTHPTTDTDDTSGSDRQ